MLLGDEARQPRRELGTTNQRSRKLLDISRQQGFVLGTPEGSKLLGERRMFGCAR